MGDRTNYRLDYTTPDGRPATNRKPRDKINIDKDRPLQSRSNYRLKFLKILNIFNAYLFRKDFDKFSQVDTHAADLFKDILKRARARPDKLPVFQDITTVSKLEFNHEIIEFSGE